MPECPCHELLQRHRVAAPHLEIENRDRLYAISAAASTVDAPRALEAKATQRFFDVEPDDGIILDDEASAEQLDGRQGKDCPSSRSVTGGEPGGL